ncbi:MAG: GspH/FimT family pseudopilin [Candidatus Omnitrophica bacterium]|nr:GspH/FimT family pseudopilin [Candidatus Omnitrophota bacterium]
MGIRSGFTLLEVVLVSAVLVLLLVAASPGFQRAFQRLQAEESAFGFTQLLRAARDQAVFQGRTVAWAWEPSARRAQLYAVVAAADGTGSVAPLTGRAGSYAPTGPVLVTVTRDGEPVDCDCVRFFSDGTGEPAQVQLDYRGLLYTVTIDAATGAARLARGPAAG